MDVKADLYEFLKENETSMYKEKGELIAYVHVKFDDLKKFTDIVGSSAFDEGGQIVRLFENTVCVDLNDIIEYNGHEILAYRNCFEADDIERYLPDLKARVTE